MRNLPSLVDISNPMMVYFSSEQVGKYGRSFNNSEIASVSSSSRSVRKYAMVPIVMTQAETQWEIYKIFVKKFFEEKRLYRKMST